MSASPTATPAKPGRRSENRPKDWHAWSGRWNSRSKPLRRPRKYKFEVLGRRFGPKESRIPQFKLRLQTRIATPCADEDCQSGGRTAAHSPVSDARSAA